tara:strand:+ start:1967 stop:2392 length:426 start_codon:yes stop_codon:yes gene_type:complete
LEISHSFLIKRIVNYVLEPEFKSFYSENEKIVYHEGKKVPGLDLPGSISDYEGLAIDNSIYIVGEAKTTAYNLTDKGSRIQLRNYLAMSKKKENFHLIYAVPLSLFNQTKSAIFREIKKDAELNLTLHIITDTNFNEAQKI